MGFDIAVWKDHPLVEIREVAGLMERYSVGGIFVQKYEKVKKMSFMEKMKILRKTVEGRGSHLWMKSWIW